MSRTTDTLVELAEDIASRGVTRRRCAGRSAQMDDDERPLRGWILFCKRCLTFAAGATRSTIEHERGCLVAKCERIVRTRKA